MPLFKERAMAYPPIWTRDELKLRHRLIGLDEGDPLLAGVVGVLGQGVQLEDPRQLAHILVRTLLQPQLKQNPTAITVTDVLITVNKNKQMVAHNLS
jgi:hypothetical protein